MMHAEDFILAKFGEWLDGRDAVELSILDIAIESGYARSTVELSIKKLLDGGFLDREVRRGANPSRYRLISAQERTQMLVKRVSTGGTDAVSPRTTSH